MIKLIGLETGSKEEKEKLELWEDRKIGLFFMNTWNSCIVEVTTCMHILGEPIGQDSGYCM